MIIIAYGANLDSRYGNPAQTFDAVLKEFKHHGLVVVAQSSLYDTSPVGTSNDQPSYTNAVMAVDTDLPPHDLLKTLLDIEARLGRERTYQNAPRPVDLDIIDYHGQIINNDPDLILPHPRMQDRKFVLVPLRDICPEWAHPVLGDDIDDLIASTPADQIIKKIKGDSRKDTEDSQRAQCNNL